MILGIHTPINCNLNFSACYSQKPESSPTRAIGKKHQMNDVPDPPTIADVDVICKQVIWSYWYSYTERYLKSTVYAYENS